MANRHFLNKLTQITQDYYPEMMGKFVIINGGVMFSGIWKIIKGWLDEKTRNAIDILGANYLEILKKDIDIDVIPAFLGGNNQADFSNASGPWDEYDLIDSTDPGAEVGVRRKDDPDGKIFGPKDMLMLPNDNVTGLGIWETKGRVCYDDEGILMPYHDENERETVVLNDEEVEEAKKMAEEEKNEGNV